MATETVAEFAQRVAVEFGYWSEINRQVAADRETRGLDSSEAWTARRIWQQAADKVVAQVGHKP